MRQRIWIIIFCLVLTACGFHLRGMANMPTWLHQVAIIAEQHNSELYPLLRDQLQANHVTVRANPSSATYWLVIIRSEHQEQIMGVGASTDARQYQLQYFVDFMLQTPDGKTMIPPSHIIVTRQMTINNNRILGSNEETNLILAEMQREAVTQLIYRLSRPYAH